MYSMKDIATKYGITQSTIRYYDKEGLLPFIEKTKGGIRFFTDNDIEWLNFIISLKESGMSVKDIKSYIDNLYDLDNKEECLKLFEQHKQYLEKQLETIQKTLNLVNYTIWDLKKDIENK